MKLLLEEVGDDEPGKDFLPKTTSFILYLAHKTVTDLADTKRFATKSKKKQKVSWLLAVITSATIVCPA